MGVDFLQLCIPRILKNGVDSLAADTASQNDLLFLAILICIIGTIATILRFCWRYLIIGFSRHLERDIRKKIFNHVMLMDGSFFGKYSTGSIMAHTSNDLAAVQMACGMGLVAALDALVMSTAAIGFMFAIDVKLTLLALAPMPFLAIATRFLSGRLHKRFDLVQEQFSTMTEFVRSSISAIRLLKAIHWRNPRPNVLQISARNMYNLPFGWPLFKACFFLWPHWSAVLVCCWYSILADNW